MFRITGRLQEERDAAESLREKTQAHDLHLNSGSRLNELNKRAAQAQKQLSEQQEASEGFIRQMTMERDQSRTQLSEAEARAQKLQEILKQEKEAAEVLAQQLKAEQDESWTHLSSFENHLQNIEEQLALAQKQFRDQREAVTRMIQRRTVGGEENQ
jgi:chromosome segregation ATPase